MSRGRKRSTVEQVHARVHERDGEIDRLSGHFLGGARVLHHRQPADPRPNAAGLVTLCGDDELGTLGWVRTHPLEAVRLGYLVPASADLEQVPLLVADGLRKRRWVLFRANGHVAPLERDQAARLMREQHIWGPTDPWPNGKEVPDAWSGSRSTTSSTATRR